MEIHCYDWEACATLCGIDGPSPDEIVEDERDIEGADGYVSVPLDPPGALTRRA